MPGDALASTSITQIRVSCLQHTRENGDGLEKIKASRKQTWTFWRSAAAGEAGPARLRDGIVLVGGTCFQAGEPDCIHQLPDDR